MQRAFRPCPADTSQWPGASVGHRNHRQVVAVTDGWRGAQYR